MCQGEEMASRSGGCLEVIVADKEVGVEDEDDEWPTGVKSKRDSFFTLAGHVLEQGT